MGEQYEVEKRLNEGLAMAVALRDAMAAKISDLKGPFDQL